MSNFKRQPIRLPKVRKAARNAPCMMESPACNHDTETTVFCHLNYHWAGKGMGQKADDIGFFGCSDCHRWFDETPDNTRHTSGVLHAFRACVRTWRYLIETGVLS